MSHTDFRTHRWYCAPLDMRVALSLIAAGLYLPQMWFFLIDYPYCPYWFSWLWFFPGLPTFIPMGFIAHEIHGLPWYAFVALLRLGSAALVALLVWLSQRSKIPFWVTFILATSLSIVSAIGAYSVFIA